MKKLYLPVLIGFALILTACGGGDARSSFEMFSQSLREQEQLHFTSQIRAEYDDRSAEFTLDYSAGPDGCTVTVLAPEIIKGVSAHVAAGETALAYDSVVLDTGLLDEFGLTPMSALPLLVEAMKTGYLDSAWEEDDQLAALIVPSDEVSVELRLDKYAKIPLSAEIASAGRVRIFAQISDWNRD